MDASSTEQTNGKQQKKPRFQLCFSTNDRIASKSDIHKATVKLCGISTPIVTPKFYTPNNAEITEEQEKEVEELVRKLATVNELGPREKYKEPVLESHRYGWFQERFIEPNPEIDRVHFPKRTSEMVRMQNMFMQSKACAGKSNDDLKSHLVQFYVAKDQKFCIVTLPERSKGHRPERKIFD